MRRAAILSSRQALRPCGTDEWVRATAEAIDWIARSDVVLNCSVGQSSWELTLALASSAKLPLRVFIPIVEREDHEAVGRRIAAQFELDYADAELIPVGTGDDLSRPEAMRVRDLAILKQSDILVPISVRKGGFMDRAVGSHEGQYVVRNFAVPHQTRRVGLAYDIEPTDLSPEARTFDEPFVIHWTRTAAGPWPGETKMEYYRSVAASDDYPRAGLHTLRRILDSRRLVASGWRMPERRPCVCFSALPPVEVAPLMRWRARYRRMSFEPYGIGLRRSVAEDLGIVPVHYYNADSEEPPDGENRWRWQSSGAITDWRQEQEYRHCGDVDLSAVDDEDMVVFCRFREETECLRRESGLRVIAVTSR